MKTDYNRVAVWTWVRIVPVLVLWPAIGLSQDAKAPQDPWAKYQVILQRNMFSRQRGALRERRGDAERREVAVPNPESYFRLKGIVQEDGTFIAFLEDMRSNSVLKLRQGDSVARGTLKALTLDTIEYQFGDQVTAVQLGSDLEGGRGAVTMNELMEFSETSAGAPTAVLGEPAETLTGDGADILEQLMKRRKQQLGQ